MDAPLPRPDERWTVRHRLADGRATDVVGWVESVDGSAWRMLLRDGADPARAVIDPRTVILARRAPAAAGGPNPARTSAADLERIALPGWQADHEPLGEWTLRSGGGFTGRANSCLAVGDPGVAYAVAAAAIRAYAARAGFPPMAQVVVGSTEEAGLVALGWQPTYVETAVLAARLVDVLADGRGLPDDRVEVTETLDDRWLRAYATSRPTDADPAVVRAILTGGPPRAYASVGGERARTDHEPVAIGRGHLNAGWLGVAAVWTAPERRRQGLAAAVVTGLGHWAARRGARWAYLQVAAANTVAVAAYARLGFGPHHLYRYLAPPT